ncbi:hypothetical protein BT63DRAFT_44544 [Microthyrium microscopicum]|uniref:Sodium/calcium exchanger membrane region domain-containing protein n=1 Tax=Microthyrium microscopicum TaxID=703497 RepID=A0A6A6U0V8_9PEZI|nr:hypothetical protein BT63DRAFT_44544 [Microthyrium microscopicum]
MALLFLPQTNTFPRPAKPNARLQRLDRARRVFQRVILTALVVCLIAYTCSFFVAHRSRPIRLNKRNDVFIKDEECQLVHNAIDQCAFVIKNCDDEEPGYIHYLQLYYCTLPKVKPLAFIVIISWLGLLFSTIGLAASDFFCVNLGSLATMAGMSENFAGVTLLALGNGSPDVFSTFAAMYNNSGSLAIGELVGAAGFITAVIAGSMAFIRPFKVPRKTFLRDVIFFIIAASFTLVFLADGKLQLWECIVMVSLYIIYVGIVVFWHWYFKKKRTRRLTELAARSQHSYPGTGAAEFGGEYRDEDEDRDPRDRLSTRTGNEDFEALEHGANEHEDEDEEEDRMERVRGHLSSQMRLRRPRAGDRRSTHDPIRPSLLGALEFRSVLSGLHRVGNLQVYPMNNRRYSEDPTLVMFQDQRSTISEPNQVEFESAATKRPSIQRTASGNRTRAVSAIEPGVFGDSNLPSVPRIDLQAPVDEEPVQDQPSDSYFDNTSHKPPPSPTISISPPPSERRVPAPDGQQARRSPSPKGLAPPGPIGSRSSHQPSTTSSLKDRGVEPHKLDTSVGSHSSQVSQFPVYTDESFPASPMSMGSETPFRLPSPVVPSSPAVGVGAPSRRPLTWWPYWLLPKPEELIETLFPTLQKWNDKGFLGRIFGILSAPSVFCLTITLPVVEIAKDDEVADTIPDISRAPTVSSTQILPHIEGIEQQPPVQVLAEEAGLHGPPAVVAPPSGSRTSLPDNNHLINSPEQLPSLGTDDEGWNRWLVILQVFTAPLFCTVIIWANVDYGNLSLLLYYVLVSLVISLIFLTFVLFTSNPDYPPMWYGLLCVLGFAVSIGWISTIAGEVVGVLKALGIIFNISDAILGLTVFAVGNSLGDLVADVTMAKLGYSVMALSACFGGPMLNILLGIGLSGAYMTISQGQQRKKKHPGKKFKVKPYIIEVDRTLMISGIALLVTLVGLLIVVPLRRWRMDRVVGWFLIGLWIVTTIGNLGTELWLGQGTWAGP